MNQRQKKKRFKKVYGKNPPAGWIATERGYAIRKGRVIISKKTAGKIIREIQIAFQGIAESLRKIWETYKKEMLKIEDAAGCALNNIEIDSIRNGIRWQRERGITVTTKALTRRREERTETEGREALHAAGRTVETEADERTNVRLYDTREDGK